MDAKSSVEPVEKQGEPSRKEVWQMFDRIAHRYDLLNRLLSGGQDVVWRNRLARCLPNRRNQRILDLATGTGDLLISIFKHNPDAREGIGIDLAEKMLARGREKLVKRDLDKKISLRNGDAANIPFGDAGFDTVTISFGIRNVENVSRALREMRRVLKPGGRAIILEFSLPKNVLFRRSYLFYFRHILPRIGGLISGDSYAYSYLNQTVETFPYGDDFCRLMEGAGFSNVSAIPLTFGIASIYSGDNDEN